MNPCNGQYSTLISLLLLLAIFVALVAVVGAFTFRELRNGETVSPGWIALSVAPGMIQLALFYSLALHMWCALGGWPQSIGEYGFPAGLIMHAGIALDYFGGFILANVFMWPVAFVLCVLKDSWRRWAKYLGVYFLSGIQCIVLMLLAPPPFLNWWWD